MTRIPVRGYHVSVELEPAAPETVMVWTGQFRRALPGTGRPVQAALRLVLGTFARRLAVAAGRRTGSASTAGAGVAGGGT